MSDSDVGKLYSKAYADAEEYARQNGQPWPPEQPRRCRTCLSRIAWELRPDRWVHVFDHDFPPCDEPTP